MVKINTVRKIIKVFVPKTGTGRFVQKPAAASVFTEPSNNIKYIHNVLEYKPRQVTPQEVKSLFIDGKIDGGYLRDEMKRVKRKLLKSSLTNISNFKKWKHSVNFSKNLSESDLIEIADFMNMHNGKFINV